MILKEDPAKQPQLLTDYVKTLIVARHLKRTRAVPKFTARMIVL